MIKSVEEFNEELAQDAERMDVDLDLKDASKEILIRADHYRWIHQTKWMGLPVLQTPEDLLQIQEIIWKTKPDVIIECGVAFGGGTLFLSNVLNNLPGWKCVIGIDKYIPAHLVKQIQDDAQCLEDHLPSLSFIELIEGDTTSEETIDKVKNVLDVGDWEKKVMVILDSNHSHDHVLKELNIYSPFVQSGQYIIVSDTWADEVEPSRPREWGPGNSPRTAMKEFLRNNKEFQIDRGIQKKLLMSTNPDGYLVRK